MCMEDIADTLDECNSDLIYLHQLYIFISHTIEINHLIIIPLLGSMIRSSSQQVQQNKPIVYISDDLKCIRDIAYHDQCYRILSGHTCQTIRNLRINNKRKRGSKVGLKTKNIVLHSSVNLSNLIKVDINNLPCNQAYQKTTKHSTINVQSVKSKDLILHQYICDNKIDLCILTETWLRDRDTDRVWISCTSLNNRSLKMDTSNRIGQQGGGLALVYGNMLNVTNIDQANNRTFPFAIWKISCKVYTIIIIGIYHAPYLTVNQCTNAMFLDEFTE